MNPRRRRHARARRSLRRAVALWINAHRDWNLIERTRVEKLACLWKALQCRLPHHVRAREALLDAARCRKED